MSHDPSEIILIFWFAAQNQYIFTVDNNIFENWILWWKYGSKE